jgi:hypothetical protein
MESQAVTLLCRSLVVEARSTASGVACRPCCTRPCSADRMDICRSLRSYRPTTVAVGYCASVKELPLRPGNVTACLFYRTRARDAILETYLCQKLLLYFRICSVNNVVLKEADGTWHEASAELIGGPTLVGIFDSLLDVPRIATLFFLILCTAQTVARRRLHDPRAVMHQDG